MPEDEMKETIIMMKAINEIMMEVTSLMHYDEFDRIVDYKADKIIQDTTLYANALRDNLKKMRQEKFVEKRLEF